MSVSESSAARLSTATRLLPVAVLVGAITLFVSELMVTFEFTPPGAEPVLEQTARDRHGNAVFVIAAFAIGALILAVMTASKPAAIGVAIAGGLGLAVFLLFDLPDAGAIGTLDDQQSFVDAEAVPREGFWLELVGSLCLAVTGIALATLTPEQLAALRPGSGGRLRASPAESNGAPGGVAAGRARSEAAASERSRDRGRTAREREGEPDTGLIARARRRRRHDPGSRS